MDPLRREGDAFKLLLYAIVMIAVVTALILALR